MHELGITRNIVAIVAEAARGWPVRRITVEIGALAGLLSEAVAFCFDAVAQGTALEGASLDIVEIPGRARCTACGADYALATLLTPCACGARARVLLQGEELNIKSMELREAA